MGGRSGRVRVRGIPKHLGTDAEGWRAKKRAQWLEVMAALDRYNYGAAYTPGSMGLHEIRREAERINTLLQAEGWIAWHEFGAAD